MDQSEYVLHDVADAERPAKGKVDRYIFNLKATPEEAISALRAELEPKGWAALVRPRLSVLYTASRTERIFVMGGQWVVSSAEIDPAKGGCNVSYFRFRG